MIKENKLITDDLNFKPVSSNFVSKQINKLNIKKATGYDGISPKILKLSMPCIVELLKSGLTCTVLSLSGKIDTSIHLLIKNVISSTIQGIDSF
jgi:hypothetical protein